MTAWDGLNRRKFPRVRFPCLVIVKYDKKEQDVLLTHTENIGVGGICVILKKSLRIFTPVSLEIDLLDTENHIFCEGKVVWSVCRRVDEKKKPSFYDVGIEFTEMGDPDINRLQIIIDRFVKKGLQARV